MRVLLLAAAAIAAALVLAVPAVADESYTDSTGETAGSADISTVDVADANGSITFTVTTNLPAIDANTLLGIVVVPHVSGTGLADGYVVLTTTDGTVVVDTLLGSTEEIDTESFTGGVWTVTVPEQDFDYPTVFDFSVVTAVGPDPNNPIKDVAPDNGVWTYTLVDPTTGPPLPTPVSTTPPVSSPPPLPAAKPKPVIAQVSTVRAVYNRKPRAGKLFVAGLTVSLSTGLDTKATHLRCVAKLQGKLLRGHGIGGCRFLMPSTAKGEHLVVKVSGRYRTVGISRTLAFKVS
jgi:hypothetical protein